ncbi:HAMP domain-containing sensor histidine kinase [Clostridium sp. KNHs205]|uniref:sensor histidine kinase n=1 Tax=Clostridium sp. KNHs205 TaxID=1449050 RepID=UPI00051BC1DE|nr:HAMP domain-containing sensor histidine kinase [Clostridium sp. KNHs205]
MKRKISLYFMLIILLTLGLVILGFWMGIRYYFYNGIVNTFQNKVQTVEYLWPDQSNIIGGSFLKDSDNILKSYQVRGTKLELLSKSGKLLQSSDGFYSEITYQINPKVIHAEIIYKIEQQSNHEKIMTVYAPLLYGGQVVYILRYSTSLSKTEDIINHLMLYALSISAVIAGIVFLVSLQLGSSFVRPLNDIISLTNRMAEGKYKDKIDKIYPNEPGDIVRILNYMGDEIQKTDQLKNEFISSISHELRTPLTGIKGWVETMKEPDSLTKEELVFGMEIISEETERLIGLVENLLDFSRYQSERFQLIKEEVSLDKLIDDAAFQLRKKAESRNIDLKVTTCPVSILADGDKLKQVVLNVLDNAIKFSHQNSSIRIEQSVEEELVAIKISDTGIGIKAEYIADITESFYKVNPKILGEGLGLAISKKIVMLHGGTLQIESKYEIGTSVNITLPRINDEKQLQ